MNAKEQQLAAMLTPSIKALGCELWGLEVMSQGKYSKLRIYIEKAEGVNVDDCAQVSRQVSDLLDIEEAFTNSYTLEVSSPGLDRTLYQVEQYLQYVGQTLEVRLNFAFEGRRKVIGVLAGIENDEVVLQADGEEFLLPIENIQRAKIVPVFE